MNEIYGLLGKKLGYSFSPIIHNIILKELNINGLYCLFEVEEDKLNLAFEGFKILKIKGINVTIPYKIKTMELVDELSLEAKNIGSINTIKFMEGYSIGYNTDYFGFISSLSKYNIDVKNKIVYVLGTGGASRAVIQALKDLNSKKIIAVTRNKKNKKDLDVELIDYYELSKKGKGDILINCTPLGMNPDLDILPIEIDIIANFSIVYDLIYNPKETILMKWAKQFNIPSYNGMAMLVYQAIKAQEVWNGTNLDIKLADKIIEILNKDVLKM